MLKFTREKVQNPIGLLIRYGFLY